MKVKLENLDNYEKTLTIYHSESQKKEINEIHNKKEEIKTITYKTFYSKEKMIINQLLENCRIIFEKVNTIKSLNIFQIIYHMIINTKKNIKISINKEDKDDFDSAFEDFKELKKYLEEKGIENIESTKFGYILRSIAKDAKAKQELRSLYNTKDGGDELEFMMNRQGYEEDLNSIFYFLEYFEKQCPELIELKSEWNELAKNNNNNNNNSKFEEILIKYKKEGLYDYTKEIKNKKSKYVKIFRLFYEGSKKKAFDFLIKKNINELKTLYDKIEPNDSSTISIKDIEDTMKCVGFFQELKKKNNLKDLLYHIKKNIDEEDGDLFNRFDNYIKNFRAIDELNQNFDYFSGDFEKIREIMQNALFVFNQDKDEFTYGKNGEEITIQQIKEYKIKSHIKQKDKISNNINNKFNEKFETIKLFKNVADNIEELSNLMDILRKKGSTLPISIKVEIKNQDVKYFLKNKKKEFKEFKNFYQKLKQIL